MPLTPQSDQLQCGEQLQQHLEKQAGRLKADIHAILDDNMEEVSTDNVYENPEEKELWTRFGGAADPTEHGPRKMMGEEWVNSVRSSKSALRRLTQCLPEGE